MNKPTIKEVEDWVRKLYDTCEETITASERAEQRKYAIMVQRPQDKKFLVKMLDESSQIRDRKKLALRIKTLIDMYSKQRLSKLHRYRAVMFSPTFG